MGGSATLDPARHEQFLVYVMGPYRAFDVGELLPDDADTDTEVPSFATCDSTAGEYSEDEALRLLQETRECLRERGFNAFAIDVDSRSTRWARRHGAPNSLGVATRSSSSHPKSETISGSASKSGAFSKTVYRPQRK